MAIIALNRPGPRTRPAPAPGAGSGTARITSMTRMIAVSTMPPTKPATRPSAMPTEQRGRDHDHADEQRVARAVDQPREDVAADRVGAERERPAAAFLPDRRLQDSASRNCSSGGCGAIDVGEDGDEDEEDEKHEADRPRRGSRGNSARTRRSGPGCSAGRLASASVVRSAVSSATPSPHMPDARIDRGRRARRR